MHMIRRGSGRPLLLVHGVGSSHRAWDPVAGALAAERALFLVDLPGHGATPAADDSASFAGLARSLAEWLAREGLAGVDMAGSSLGGRLVLEMARRGLAGNVVALDPGGFWQGWERTYLRTTLLASGALLRAIRPMLPLVSRNPVSRSLLLVQLSAAPWRLDGGLVATELAGLAATATFDALVRDLAAAPPQQGPAATPTGRVTLGWGRHDRLTLPVQAARAQAAFPGARLHWFDRSGHFPMWDEPAAAAAVILDGTAAASPGQ